MDVGRLDTLRGIVQNRVTDLQQLEVEVVMVESFILENAVAEVMVVTKTAGVTSKLETLQHNMVGAIGKQVIGPIVMLFLGGRKRRHQMLLSQVIFWFVIVWLLYYLTLALHFHMYLPHLLMVLIYIVNCLTYLFVFLPRWVSLRRRAEGKSQKRMPTRPILAAEARLANWVRAPKILSIIHIW